MSFSEWEEFSPQVSSRYWQYRDNQGMPAGRVVEQKGNGRYDFFAYAHKGGGRGKGVYPSLGRFHTLDEAQAAVKSDIPRRIGLI